MQVLIQETGEHVLLTLGEVHLERCITDLENDYAKIKLNVSKPIVQFRETIVLDTEKDKSDDKTITISTANKQCCIKIMAVPLPEEVVSLLDKNNELFKVFSENNDIDTVSSTVQDTLKVIKDKLKDIMVMENALYNFDVNTVDKIWSIGPKKCGTNILINLSDYKHPCFWKSNDTDNNAVANDPRCYFDNSFINGFQLATLAGPLCDEPMQGVGFIIKEWLIDNMDELHTMSHGPFSGKTTL